MKRCFVLAILGLATSATAVHAEYMITGVGTAPCAQWVSARHDQKSGAFEQWVVGFLTGVGFAKSNEGVDPLRTMNAEGAWNWIDGYCREHPIGNISEAAGAFAQAHPH
jgi:hypothetical protein